MTVAAGAAGAALPVSPAVDAGTLATAEAGVAAVPKSDCADVSAWPLRTPRGPR